MTKAELITVIAEDAGITKIAAAKALDSYIINVGKELQKGGKLGIVGFGTFMITKRKARIGRNPQTGDQIEIPEKKVIKFKAGKSLIEKIK